MNLSMKQKQTHDIENRFVVAKGWERNRLGVWGQQMQTIPYRMDKPQGPTVQQRIIFDIL